MTAPRLGFLGVGWIGLHRMQALLDEGAGVVAALADPDPEARQRALAVAPQARVVRDLDAMLSLDLDGVVVATPSALHAEQSIAALQAGVPVFCQKPLGRNAHEVQRVLAAAREADRRLGVDLSYRHTAALRAVRELVRAGDLGQIHALDLTFHNAWGPDKAWFRDPALSGGGCVVDLGIHLVDAALWLLDHPEVVEVRSRLYHRGKLLPPEPAVIEDFAVSELALEGGCVVRLACSWNLPAGCEAVIGVSAWGTAGGAGLRNVDGSFYDFVAERWRGVRTERLTEPPDAWGGRALVEWARGVARDPGFHEDDCAGFLDVAHTLDRIYGRA